MPVGSRPSFQAFALPYSLVEWGGAEFAVRSWGDQFGGEAVHTMGVGRQCHPPPPTLAAWLKWHCQNWHNFVVNNNANQTFPDNSRKPQIGVPP